MMITQMGFSKKLGQVAWTGGGGPSFLGQSMGQPSDCSGQTNDEIDEEVKLLVNRAYRCVSVLPGSVILLMWNLEGRREKFRNQTFVSESGSPRSCFHRLVAV